MRKRTNFGAAREESRLSSSEGESTGKTAADDQVAAWLNKPAYARLANAFAIEFVVRYMHDAAQLFGGDYESAIIFLAILESNGRQTIRQPWFAEESTYQASSETARPISRHAVAESLGIPRETVRRKIADLVARGFLIEAPGGVITTLNVIENDAFLATRLRIAGYVRQLVTDLRQYTGMPLGG